MAMFEIHCVDEQIKALPTIKNADSVSINIWDEQWESGAFDFSTGAKVGNSSTIRSKNYIPCKPSTSYYNNNTSGHTYVFFYDMTKAFISYGDYKNMVFTTPSNAYYMMFYKSSGYGTTYNHDICINFPSTETAYSAYKNHIVTFDTDMTENLIDVECEIVYSQAEGTPSLDNQLPITTFSEMNVIHKGKNLIDDSLYYQAGANTVVIGQTLPNSNRTIFLKAGTYTIKAETSVAGSIYYDFGNGSTRIGSTSEVGTFTLENDSWCSFSLYKSGGFSPSDYSSVQLEFGNTATDYQAFNGNTYNIPFGQSVAKGTLNVTTGVLKFDKGAVTLDGTQPDSDFALSAMTGFTRITFNPYNNIGVINATFISNILEYVSNPNQYGEGKIWSSGTASRMFLGLPESVTNKSQMQAWFSSNPTQVVFDYADEQVVQLSPTQITALLNENNIWCDTNGDTTVKFLLTVGKAIS